MTGKRPRAATAITAKDRRQIPVKLKAVGKEAALASVSSRTMTLQIEIEEAPDTDTNAATAGRGAGWWPASGARDVRLFRNGSLVTFWEGDLFAETKKEGCILQLRSSELAPRRSVCTATIPIVAGLNNFTAYAFNRDNIKSQDAKLVMNGAESLQRPGTAYILAVGVNRYSNRGYNLKYAVADAQEFSAEVKRRLEALKRYAQVEVIPLVDSEATKARR